MLQSREPLYPVTDVTPPEPHARLVEWLALPSRKELALQWLTEHPEDVHQPYRWLEQHRHPQGQDISYGTWRRARLDLEEGR